jgi:hypothetical protein
MTKSGIVALAVIMATTGAAAADPEPDPQQSEKKICRTEPVTGSRARVRRICMTDAQWRELALRTQEGMDQLGNRRASGQLSSTPDGQAMGNGAISIPGGPGEGTTVN